MKPFGVDHIPVAIDTNLFYSAYLLFHFGIEAGLDDLFCLRRALPISSLTVHAQTDIHFGLHTIDKFPTQQGNFFFLWVNPTSGTAGNQMHI